MNQTKGEHCALPLVPVAGCQQQAQLEQLVLQLLQQALRRQAARLRTPTAVRWVQFKWHGSVPKLLGDRATQLLIVAVWRHAFAPSWSWGQEINRRNRSVV